MFDLTKLEKIIITVVAESGYGEFIFQEDSEAGSDWMATIGKLMKSAEDAVSDWKFDRKAEAEADGEDADLCYDLIVEIDGREINKQCFA